MLQQHPPDPSNEAILVALAIYGVFILAGLAIAAVGLLTSKESE